MKRIIAAGLVHLVLVCMVTVSATEAGSSADSLITRSYLVGEFANSLQTEITTTIGGSADRAISRLNELVADHAGYSFAPRFTLISLTAGGTVAIISGGSFVLLSGTATLEVKSGIVINVSNGAEVQSGSGLNANQRYFCVENTTAVITASTAATGQVDGYYQLVGATAQAPLLPFSDVPTGAWFFPAIDFVYKNEIFAGTALTVFSPNTAMTRGMFVTVLHRLDGRPAVESDVIFSDMGNPLMYYYGAVAWANLNGIVRGYADGSFGPDRSITREEMAAIMHRYATYKNRDMSASGAIFDAFPDKGNVSEFAVPAMQWAVSREVIRGSTGGMLLPKNTATRAEVAQIIFNYCDKVGR